MTKRRLKTRQKTTQSTKKRKTHTENDDADNDVVTSATKMSLLASSVFSNTMLTHIILDCVLRSAMLQVRDSCPSSQQLSCSNSINRKQKRKRIQKAYQVFLWYAGLWSTDPFFSRIMQSYLNHELKWHKQHAHKINNQQYTLVETTPRVMSRVINMALCNAGKECFFFRDSVPWMFPYGASCINVGQKVWDNSFFASASFMDYLRQDQVLCTLGIKTMSLHELELSLSNSFYNGCNVPVWAYDLFSYPDIDIKITVNLDNVFVDDRYYPVLMAVVDWKQQETADNNNHRSCKTQCAIIIVLHSEFKEDKDIYTGTFMNCESRAHIIWSKNKRRYYKKHVANFSTNVVNYKMLSVLPSTLTSFVPNEGTKTKNDNDNDAINRPAGEESEDNEQDNPWCDRECIRAQSISHHIFKMYSLESMGAVCYRSDADFDMIIYQKKLPFYTRKSDEHGLEQGETISNTDSNANMNKQTNRLIDTQLDALFSESAVYAKQQDICSRMVDSLYNSTVLMLHRWLYEKSDQQQQQQPLVNKDVLCSHSEQQNHNIDDIKAQCTRLYLCALINSILQNYGDYIGRALWNSRVYLDQYVHDNENVTISIPFDVFSNSQDGQNEHENEQEQQQEQIEEDNDILTVPLLRVIF